MGKQKILWNTAKEAYRKAKGLLSKNERNTEKYQAKKERGPVKAMFHITKNENAPLIEQQGLVANNPNANINSAYQPFKSVGVKGGGNWVTDQPTAFPVYGTTVGGKAGNKAARRDALTTFKIELPVSKLPTMKAVRDPYGDAELTTADKGWSLFGTWANKPVGTMAILEDIDPKYLKNLGYVEEVNIPKPFERYKLPRLFHSKARQRGISHSEGDLSSADRNALSGKTGHRSAVWPNGKFDISKSPARFVEEYLDRNKPIAKRSPKSPESRYFTAGINQFTPARVTELNEFVQPSNFDHYRTQLKQQAPTAEDWTNKFRPYVKQGETPKQITFQPGSYSRGMGHLERPSRTDLRDRHFDWDLFDKNIVQHESPWLAARDAQPQYLLDWDNIVYRPNVGYTPKVITPHDGLSFEHNEGHISRGTPRGHVIDALTGKHLVNPNTQGATQQFYNLGPGNIKSLKYYNAYDDIVKDPDHPTWQELVRVIMRINAETSTPFW